MESHFFIPIFISMQTVANILQQKGPQFNMIDGDVSVKEAISLMKSENSSYLIVFNKGEYAGIFSEKDCTQKITLMNRQSDTTKVIDVLTTNLPVVHVQESDMQCMQIMHSHDTGYLPVYDGFNFKGIITLNDLVRERISN